LMGWDLTKIRGGKKGQIRPKVRILCGVFSGARDSGEHPVFRLCCEYVRSERLAENVGLLSSASLVKRLLSNHNRAKYGDTIEASENAMLMEVLWNMYISTVEHYWVYLERSPAPCPCGRALRHCC
jgi:hypothetical protein